MIAKGDDKWMPKDRPRTFPYWKAVYRTAWGNLPKAPFLRQIGGAIVMALLAYFVFQITLKNVGVALLSAAITGVVVFIIEFLSWVFVATPAELHNELQEALVSKELESAALRKEKEERPRLAIELEDEANGWNGGSQNGMCRITVRNTSQHSTANDVGLSLLEIIPEPQRVPRPLPYELGKAGTNCAEKKVQLHAGMGVKFDLFRFYLHSEVKFRDFQIQDVPQTRLEMVPMLALQSQEGETREWQIEVRATGLNLITVPQRFKLVCEARAFPRLFKV
jgi:hypothetical protein